MNSTPLAALLIAASIAGGVQAGYPSYNVHRNTGTYSQLQNMFTGAYQKHQLDFESTIASLYASLLAKQESLGEDFEKILYDNLWELYVDY